MRSDVLRKRGRLDCGCSNRVDLLGRTFGKLKVTATAYVGRRNIRFWRCECECGEEHPRNLSTRELLKGWVTSCGCAANPHGEAHPTFNGHEEIYGGFWNVVRKQASVRGISFDLDIADAWDLFLKQDRRCALTGLPISMGKPRRNEPEPRTASLDRIDSKKGYAIGNVQWVHKDINMMKRDMSTERFVSLCAAVASGPKNCVAGKH